MTRHITSIDVLIAGQAAEADVSAENYNTRRSRTGHWYVGVEGGMGVYSLSDQLTLSAAWQFLGTAALIERISRGSIDPTADGFMLGLHHSF